MASEIVKTTAIQELRATLSKQDTIAALKDNLGKSGISVEKFNMTVLAACEKTPDLLNADRSSLYSACKAAAREGLLPDGREAALVMFGNKVQFMPMTAGLLKKIRNSGELQSISPHVVRKGDEFDYWIDEDGEHLKHRPSLDDSPRDITHAYCLAKTKDGGIYIEVLTKGEVDQVRASSRAKGGPWNDWYSEMAKKTAIRRLSKRLPMSSDMEMVLRQDDGMTDVEAAPAETAEPEEKPRQRASRVGKIVDAVATASAPEPEPEPPTVVAEQDIPL